jgi:hypothetical protein
MYVRSKIECFPLLIHIHLRLIFACKEPTSGEESHNEFHFGRLQPSPEWEHKEHKAVTNPLAYNKYGRQKFYSRGHWRFNFFFLHIFLGDFLFFFASLEVA